MTEIPKTGGDILSFQQYVNFFLAPMTISGTKPSLTTQLAGRTPVRVRLFSINSFEQPPVKPVEYLVG
jgi:hypothetical protein